MQESRLPNTLRILNGGVSNFHLAYCDYDYKNFPDEILRSSRHVSDLDSILESNEIVRMVFLGDSQSAVLERLGGIRTSPTQIVFVGCSVAFISHAVSVLRGSSLIGLSSCAIDAPLFLHTTDLMVFACSLGKGSLDGYFGSFDVHLPCDSSVWLPIVKAPSLWALSITGVRQDGLLISKLYARQTSELRPQSLTFVDVQSCVLPIRCVADLLISCVGTLSLQQCGVPAGRLMGSPTVKSLARSVDLGISGNLSGVLQLVSELCVQLTTLTLPECLLTAGILQRIHSIGTLRTLNLQSVRGLHHVGALVIPQVEVVITNHGLSRSIDRLSILFPNAELVDSFRGQ